MQDQTLTCKDCGTQFTWTASEQEFYKSKGFSAPQRCADCRRKFKQERQGGRFDRGPRTMHQITCANCGAQGEVPFEPRDPSNVLCADCFRKKREAERGGAPAAVTQPADAPQASSDDAEASDTSDEKTDTKSADSKEE